MPGDPSGPQNPIPESTGAELAQRYGPPPSPRRRRQWAAIALIAAAGTALVVWIGLGQARDSTYWANIGFDLKSNTEVSVTYRVGKDPQATITCELRALNRTKAVVGLARIRVGPSSERVTQRTDSVRTSSQAVTGIVESCG